MTNGILTKHRPFGWRDKLGYLFGDFGNDFFFILVANFLMVFYTDIFHIHSATIVPATFYVTIFLILVFLYPLNKEKTLTLAEDLSEKRKG